MTASELDMKVMDRVKRFDVYPLLSYFSKVPDGQRLEILDQTDHENKYYQYLACLVQELHPQQVVELGASIGISAIMMGLYLYLDAKLYSVDNGHDYREGMKAWEAIDTEIPQLVKIWGDDLDLSVYPKECDLSKTDLLFIDTEHKGEQLQKELDLYLPRMKKGCVVVLDDIRINDMFPVWEKIEKDKIEITHPCHYSGFGMFIV